MPKAASLAVFHSIDLAASKKSYVLGIRARPAALDVVEPELVQAARDLDLVRQREDQAFALGAVAQSRVVENDLVAHRPVPPVGTAALPATSAATTALPMALVPTGRRPAVWPGAGIRSPVR
jgi:hypothetical protein